jgi:hypothetical protein
MSPEFEQDAVAALVVVIIAAALFGGLVGALLAMACAMSGPSRSRRKPKPCTAGRCSCPMATSRATSKRQRPRLAGGASSRRNPSPRRSRRSARAGAICRRSSARADVALSGRRCAGRALRATGMRPGMSLSRRDHLGSAAALPYHVGTIDQCSRSHSSEQNSAAASSSTLTQ